MKTCCLLFLSACLLCAQPPKSSKDMCTPPPSGVAPSLPAKLMEGQGQVHFAITTSNPMAQKFFDQGVAQLHSFWSMEAERSFLQAAELDPEAPMPQWGVAMVAAGDYRPRFQIDNADRVFGKGNPYNAQARAIAAIKKAQELAAVSGKATDIDKMYIAALVARRDLTRADREDAYTEGLRAIVKQHPDEIEARTYLALHLMRGFELPDKTPRGTSMEAVEILRDLLNRAPEHPGVHHYVIHGFEGSTFAKDAWPSCKRYSELVTNIPHALHMPGHIYSQTGRWADAEKSFTDAAVNERGYMQADALYGSGHHGHNVHYLATSLSFQGKYQEAMQAAHELLGIQENPREKANLDGFYSAYRQGWFATLRTLVQSENWDAVLDGTTLPEYDKPREQAWRHWARALAYAAKNDVAQAKTESKAMDDSLVLYRDKVKMPLPEPLKVARLELDGHLKAAEGKVRPALKKLDEAARAELHMAYSEPPYYPRPVLETLGEIALRSGRNAQAEAAFRRALIQYPGSFRAQSGLRAAIEKQGRNVEASAAY